MAGILNSKQRIMDVLITNNGRRQIADGNFKIEFASFSDQGVFYRDDGTGTADDAGSRIMFEGYSSSTDTVVPEINSKNAISMDTTSGKRLFDGSVVETIGTATFLSGAIDIYSSSNEVIQTAIDHIDRLQIIGSHNPRVINEYFKLNKNNISFDKVSKPVKNINTIPAMWASESTNSQPEFRYMAPTCTLNGIQHTMASYAKINYEPTKTFSSLKSKLKQTAQSRSVNIESSDQITNLLIQCFETGVNEIKKLSIVDYGSYFDPSGKFLGSIYHLGKMYRDDQNNPKFIRLMSILFE
tara:strand:+ start:3839 stop:4732 length:894 start_codon:yes stop_codon:yes gene_type:complete